jgi:hypothetical protein
MRENYGDRLMSNLVPAICMVVGSVLLGIEYGGMTGVAAWCFGYGLMPYSR